MRSAASTAVDHIANGLATDCFDGAQHLRRHVIRIAAVDHGDRLGADDEAHVHPETAVLLGGRAIGANPHPDGGRKPNRRRQHLSTARSRYKKGERACHGWKAELQHGELPIR
jgi:hypothetical protein